MIVPVVTNTSVASVSRRLKSPHFKAGECHQYWENSNRVARINAELVAGTLKMNTAIVLVGVLIPYPDGSRKYSSGHFPTLLKSYGLICSIIGTRIFTHSDNIRRSSIYKRYFHSLKTEWFIYHHYETKNCF